MTPLRLLLLLAATFPAFPQVRFEVASVRRSDPNATVQMVRVAFTPNGFTAQGMTVGDLLDMLNGYQLFRVQGGPGWMRTDRYEITAKAGEPLPEGDRTAALMDLLAERFHLAVHKETRPLATTVLLAAKNPPPGLKAAAAEEKIRVVYGADNAPTFTAWTMRAFTNYLSNMLHNAVADQTGLTGAYDFALDVPDAAPGETWADRVRAAIPALGLKLEDRKIPTEITVVDRLERPAEN